MSGQGLSVIGVTGETPEKTEPWIEKHGAEFAYAYDKGNALFSKLGMTARPSAVLVDPSGTVVWSGHPSGLSPDVLEASLATALPMTQWEWPVAGSKVFKALAGGKLKTALKEAEKVANKPDCEAIPDIVRKVIGSRVLSAEKALEEGNFLHASVRAAEAKKALSGLPEAKRAATVLAATKTAPAKKCIKLQKKVLKLRAEKAKIRLKRNVDDLLEELEKIKKKGKGSAASMDADAYIAELTAFRARLRF